MRIWPAREGRESNSVSYVVVKLLVDNFSAAEQHFSEEKLVFEISSRTNFHQAEKKYDPRVFFNFFLGFVLSLPQ